MKDAVTELSTYKRLSVQDILLDIALPAVNATNATHSQTCAFPSVQCVTMILEGTATATEAWECHPDADGDSDCISELEGTNTTATASASPTSSPSHTVTALAYNIGSLTNVNYYTRRWKDCPVHRCCTHRNPRFEPRECNLVLFEKSAVNTCVLYSGCLTAPT